jgi:hypothetical protein
VSYQPRYCEAEVREAVEGANNATEALRHLGLRPAGGNHRSLRRWIEHYGISIDHFGAHLTSRSVRRVASVPLQAVLVRDSTYSRKSLKRRLYDNGLKRRICELCGQGEQWQGREMALILDHVNGDATDNRLENLRIVCPNCNATLDTHCGRGGRIEREPRECLRCGSEYVPRYERQKYCSRACGVHSRGPTEARPERRKVTRPRYEQLLTEVSSSGMCAVGRKYGVSDNAVRKLLRWYDAAEREARQEHELAPTEADQPASRAADAAA